LRSSSLVRLTFCFILLIKVSLVARFANAQLRIVSYNTLGNPTTESDFSNWSIVLQAIGDESVNGIAQRIGIMALQEVDQPSDGANAQNVANLLNGLYDVSTYQASIAPVGEGYNLQAFVYDSSQVQLLSTYILDIGTRPTWRGKFRPVGYTSSAAEFYVYSSHFKAFDGYQSTRASEATLLRSSGNNLGQGANIIYAGDYNLTGGASEPAYTTMLSSGNGQALDPENGDFSDPLKKSYSSSSPTSRIDFQFITDELDDNEGLDLIDGDYRVFGRVQRNSTTVVTSIPQLTSTSDHLPVVADYQLPAVMFAEADAVPATLLQGEVFDLNFTVSNLASVVAAIGADELNYTLSVTGDIGSLIGPDNGVDLALGPGNLHQIAFDTSSPGMKSGSILVVSGSPGVEHRSLSLNIMFEVIAAGLAGDYNDDGTINAGDYTVWRNALGAVGSVLNDPTPESVDESDYAYWRDHFGESASGGSAARYGGSTVPEPSTLLTLLIALAGALPCRSRRVARKRTGRCMVAGDAIGAMAGALPDLQAHAIELRIAAFNSSVSPGTSTGNEDLEGT